MPERFTLHPMLENDTILVMDFPLSSLLLMNDCNYPWFILVPRVENVVDTYQLDWQQQQQFLKESSLLSEVLMQIFQGKKMNVAALGNICPQLHVHHIVRFETDKTWPKPVWGQHPSTPYEEMELSALKERVIPALENVLMQGE